MMYYHPKMVALRKRTVRVNGRDMTYTVIVDVDNEGYEDATLMTVGGVYGSDLPNETLMTFAAEVVRMYNKAFKYSGVMNPDRLYVTCPSCLGLGETEGGSCFYCEGRKEVTVQKYKEFVGL